MKALLVRNQKIAAAAAVSAEKHHRINVAAAHSRIEELETLLRNVSVIAAKAAAAEDARSVLVLRVAELEAESVASAARHGA